MKSLFVAAKFLAFASLLISVSHAQSGSLDITFNPGSGANGEVKSIAVQTNGQILIGGGFTSVDGQSRKGVARLYPHGGLDGTFLPLAGVNGGLSAVAVEPDGRVYIGGGFLAYNGISRHFFARLRADGSLDLDWPDIAFNNTVTFIERQSDGSLLVVGDFTQVNGIPRKNVARLNSDGSLNSSFNPGSAVTNGIIQACVLQPDGKIIILGSFATNNPVLRQDIARVDANGILDPSFNAGYIDYSLGLGEPHIVGRAALQPDGKLLVAGNFSSINGYSRLALARLNTNGTVDTTFLASLPTGSYLDVASLVLLPSEKLLMAYSFYSMTSYQIIALLNANGSSNTSFNPAPNSLAFSIVPQPDGKLLVGGAFTSLCGTNINRIARLNGDASPATDLQFMAANVYFGTYLYGTVSNKYRVEWTSELNTPSLWTPLFNVTLQTNPQFILDPNPAAGQRYYRAVELP